MDIYVSRLLIISLCILLVTNIQSQLVYQSYNVMVDAHKKPAQYTQVQWYSSLLDSATGLKSAGVSDRLLCVYAPPMLTAFSANLTPEEAKRLSSLPGIIQVFTSPVESAPAPAKADVRF